MAYIARLARKWTQSTVKNDKIRLKIKQKQDLDPAGAISKRNASSAPTFFHQICKKVGQVFCFFRGILFVLKQ